GRKWNPLRQRFDSYDYTVKQHVIGSLLFTPLLLLLPTTSVFYIFFTILNTTISFSCILVEAIISILHATPYHEIFLWVVRPGRFPSGIWFDIVSSQSSSVLVSPTVRCFSVDSSSKNSQRRKKEEGNNEGAHFLLLFLQTNVASIGQITSPQYRAVFREVCAFSGSSSASGILTGSRIQAALQTRLPTTMPWMCITCKEYWCLCFNSVLSCLGRS
ncbi:N-acetylglucosaminyl transferase component family protein / Gpi1 family protein, partial [Thalictrum thalictroides]